MIKAQTLSLEQSHRYGIEFEVFVSCTWCGWLWSIRLMGCKWTECIYDDISKLKHGIIIAFAHVCISRLILWSRKTAVFDFMQRQNYFVNSFWCKSVEHNLHLKPWIETPLFHRTFSCCRFCGHFDISVIEGSLILCMEGFAYWGRIICPGSLICLALLYNSARYYVVSVFSASLWENKNGNWNAKGGDVTQRSSTSMPKNTVRPQFAFSVITYIRKMHKKNAGRKAVISGVSNVGPVHTSTLLKHFAIHLASPRFAFEKTFIT